MEWVTHKENQHHGIENGLLPVLCSRLNETQISEIVNLRINKKYSIKEIAEQMNVCESTIRNYLKKTNNYITYKPFGNNLSEAEKEKIKHDYLSGVPLSRIAKEFNVYNGKIIRFLQRENLND